MNDLLKLFMVAMLTMSSILGVRAQELIVGGQITSADGVVQGANVIIKGSTIGTVSDRNGNYRISAKKGDVLVFSFIGYKDQSINFVGQTKIDVYMEEDSELMEELIVVGYGYQKKSDLATSIASVNTDDLIAYPSSNVADMMKGRIAGVTVSTSSGRPGSTPSILIRGQKSISASNTPLYIIDGTPASETEFASLGASDIASIEVLKDAASQAIYGARASNGVILVTTKRGTAGETTVNYNGYVGMQTLWRNFDFYSPQEFFQLKKEVLVHDNNLSYDDPFLTDENIINDAIMYKSWQDGNFIDWEDLMFDMGVSTNHELSIKTGTDRLKVAASGNFYDEKGMVVTGSHFRRASFRINADLKVTNWLSMGVNSNMSLRRESREDGSFNEFITRPPLAQVYNEDGSYTEYINSEGERNPFFKAENYDRQIAGDSYRLNVFLDIKPFKGFNYRINASLYENIKENKEVYYKNYPGGGSAGSISESRDSDWLLENIITYDVPFHNKNHSLVFTGVQSIDHALNREIGYNTESIPVDLGPDFLANGVVSGSAVRGYGENNLVSFMLRGQYALMDRYMLNLAFRTDGSSRFGVNNKWGFFPSAAVAWRINQESFMRDISWIDNLKLRVSYGVVGNQDGIGNYTTLGLVNAYGYEFGDYYYQTYVPGTTFSNPNLKWEQSATLNTGIDFGFFNNRISGTIEYYSTHTSNLLVSRNINSALGYTSMLDNLGKTYTEGVDFSLNGDIIRKKELQLSLGANISWFRNEIVKIDDAVDEFGNPASQPGNKWFIGEPINVYYNYQMDKILQYEDFADPDRGILNNTVDTDGDGVADAPLAYPTPVEPGDVAVVDTNGDGKITEADKVIIKKDPDLIASMVMNLRWKGFEVFMDWYGLFGGTKMNNYLTTQNQGGGLDGRYNGIKVNYWTPNNPSTEFPRPGYNNKAEFKTLCGYQNTTYVRLRTLQLAYNFPLKWIDKARMSKLRLYVTATNLLTFTDVLSYDPELSTGAYPAGRSYVLGVNLSF